MGRNNLSNDYIRGLVEARGESVFYKKKGKKIPAFLLIMNIKNKKLIKAVKEKLELKNKVYTYEKKEKDSKVRSRAMLIVRDFGQIKNVIIPFFYKGLIGSKGRKFESWIERMGKDPEIDEKYRFIYKIYKEGFFDRNKRF